MRMRWVTFRTLGPIRNVYIALHQDTDSAPTRFSPSTGDDDDILRDPSSFPLCNVAGHIHDDSTSTPFDPHDNATLPPSLFASLDSPSSFVAAPRHVDETLTDVPPLNNKIYFPGSFHLAHQTVAENLHIPSTSHDSVTARGLQGGIKTSTTMTPLPAPERSAPLPPDSMASAPPPCSVTDQHIEDRHTSSDVLEISLLPSPTPALDNMLSIESRSLPRAPTAPGPSDCAIHPDTMVTLDYPSLQAEHTGDQSPRPSHRQCDIV
ncbi:hypothetical protein EDB89DRAFT_546613 [Lactarius sanguifluus]|nr:hypothetical protein EDB89DRAFT_546613 [Lactarius sanguifluus]